MKRLKNYQLIKNRSRDFQGEMVRKKVTKSTFSQLNDKRFYFPVGIVSMPFGYKTLKQINDFKKEKCQKIERFFWEDKEVLFKMEKKALKNTPRLYLYHQILLSSSKLFNINQKNGFTQPKKTLLKRNTKDIILSRECMK